MGLPNKNKKNDYVSIIRGNDKSLVKRTSQLVDRGLDLASDLNVEPEFFGNIREIYRFNINQTHQNPDSEKTPPHRHCLELSRSGEILVATSTDKCITIWDMVTGVLKQSLQVDLRKIESIDISQSCRLLVLGGSGGEIIIWDIYDEKLLHKLNVEENVNNSWSRLGLFDFAYRLDGIKIHTNEETITAHAGTRDLYSVNLKKQTSEKIYEEESKPLKLMEFSSFSDNGRVLFRSDAGLVLMDINTKTRRIISPINEMQRVLGISLSPDGDFAAICWERNISENSFEIVFEQINTNSLKSNYRITQLGPEAHRFSPHKDDNYYFNYDSEILGFTLKLTSNGRLAIVGTYNGDLVLIDNQNPSQPHILKAFNSPWIRRVSFSEKRRLIAASNAYNEIVVWSY